VWGVWVSSGATLPAPGEERGSIEERRERLLHELRGVAASLRAVAGATELLHAVEGGGRLLPFSAIVESSELAAAREDETDPRLSPVAHLLGGDPLVVVNPAGDGGV
jgi:hypothetical protein